MTIVPVILAGGIGERFWPLSRSAQPKQLLKIITIKRVEKTLLRVAPFCSKKVKPSDCYFKAIPLKFRSLCLQIKNMMIVRACGKNTALYSDCSFLD